MATTERNISRILRKVALTALTASLYISPVASAQEPEQRILTLTPTPTNIPTPTETPTPTIEPTTTPTSTPTPTPEELPWTNIAKITSYCLQGLTFLETRVRHGVVAVDPEVIPLRSIIDIDTLGDGFRAEDKGPAVRRWHIDVWSPDCGWSIDWGVQYRRVRIRSAIAYSK